MTAQITASGNGNQSLIDNLSVTSEEPTTVNIAPVIDPGSAQSTAYAANSISLGGSVSDDGLPGVGVSTEWVQPGSPGTATFSDAASPTSSVSFDYPGAYTLRLIADDGQIKAYRKTTGTLNPQTLAEWAVAESIPSGQQGANDNPDQDRWINLIEFAFGLDPNAADSGAAPWTFSPVNGSLFSISFDVPRERDPGISLAERASLSSGTWSNSAISPSITPVDGNPDWNEWTFDIDPAGAPQVFYRLTISE